MGRKEGVFWMPACGVWDHQNVVLAGNGEEVPCTHSGWQVCLQKVQWLVDMVETWWVTDR